MSIVKYTYYTQNSMVKYALHKKFMVKYTYYTQNSMVKYTITQKKSITSIYDIFK